MTRQPSEEMPPSQRNNQNTDKSLQYQAKKCIAFFSCSGKVCFKLQLIRKKAHWVWREKWCSCEQNIIINNIIFRNSSSQQECWKHNIWEENSKKGRDIHICYSQTVQTVISRKAKKISHFLKRPWWSVTSRND